MVVKIAYLIFFTLWRCWLFNMAASERITDIMFDDGAKAFLGPDISILHNVTKRGAAGKHRWPSNKIPIFIQERFSKSGVKAINLAIKEIEDYTCVHFKKIKLKDAFTTEDVAVFMTGTGCASRVGRYGGLQEVILGPSCLKHPKILHQLGHLLGMHHEHARPDREKYVKIYKEHIEEDSHLNFNILKAEEVETFGLPYDYRSIMHYSTTEYSKDGRSKTLTTTDEKYNDIIGKGKHASFRDFQFINRMFNCADKCGSKTCPGIEYFLDESCQCYCPNPIPEELPVLCSLLPSITIKPSPTVSVSKAGFSKNSLKQFTVSPIEPPKMTHGIILPSGIIFPGFTIPGALSSSASKAGFSEKPNKKFTVTSFKPVVPSGVIPGIIFPSFIIIGGKTYTASVRPSVLPSVTASKFVTPSVAPKVCYDKHENCRYWEMNGFCDTKDFDKMLELCPRTCSICDCEDHEPYCNGRKNECTTSTEVMTSCARTCGLCPIKKSCRNTYLDCYKWSTYRACHKESKYYAFMSQLCKKSCGYCSTKGTGTSKKTTHPFTSKTTKTPVCQDSRSTCMYLKNKWKYYKCKHIHWKVKCRKTCGFCGPSVCRDSSSSCGKHYLKYQCNSRHWKQKCRKSCGLCGRPGTVTSKRTTQPVTSKMTKKPVTACRDASSSCVYLKNTWNRYKCKYSSHWKWKCQKTCGLCGRTECKDKSSKCRQLFSRGCCRKIYGRTSSSSTGGKCYTGTRSVCPLACGLCS